MTSTRILSPHAAYGCRERGACCTAGWPIPIEADALARAERATVAGGIDVPAPGRPIFVRLAGAPAETPALLGTHDGCCVFHTRADTSRCALHRALGHAALPLACRQFPRVSVTDPRGVSVTLSHYCPTAADLLETTAPLRIVENVPGFPADGEYTGLDVREALPPALRPDMLMDWESWWLWESESVALLGSQADPEEALARLCVAVEHVRTWSPGAGLLSARVMSAFEAARTPDRPAATFQAFDAVAADVLATVPTDFQPQAEAALGRRSSTTAPRAHILFLAAHAFANWTAHVGEDLRAWWRSIEAAHVLLGGGMNVRDVDLLLRHLADPHAMGHCSQVRQVRRVRQATGT